MFADAREPFVPPQFGIKLAAESWEFGASAALRRYVFCHEQALFSESDRDPIDACAQTIVAVDYIMGMTHRVVGTVRIHRACDAPGDECADPSVWYGSRLAIDPAYRAVYGLGRGLVQRAVSTAHGRGCRVFLANVQAQNVEFFARLGWRRLRELTLHARPHVLMRAELAAYPPCRDEAGVSLLPARRAS